ncbi:hypothetical protein DERP_013197 [Dermatophagoides pteronyssinus]|uniref:SCP domain-containing protein n=1 Tax=Dermatophagoides pteronyssinus TaxID=6956 RepID=A0ABQ8J3C3_DERPT|nr:hypothetical protein DERP_013197 [Dermatophagoides pteronyssinus]
MSTLQQQQQQPQQNRSISISTTNNNHQQPTASCTVRSSNSSSRNTLILLILFLNFIFKSYHHHHSSSTDSSSTDPSTDSSSTPSTDPSSDNAFTEECVQIHNKYRSKHGSKPVKSSVELEKIAAKRADKLAKMDKLIHLPQDPNQHFGENLYMIYGSLSNCQIVTKAWYDEFQDFNYDFQNPQYTSNTGHATQVIWAGTQEIGCSQRKFYDQSNRPHQYTVCMYNPPGNMIGDFKNNVLPPSH